MMTAAAAAAAAAQSKLTCSQQKKSRFYAQLTSLMLERCADGSCVLQQKKKWTLQVFSLSVSEPKPSRNNRQSAAVSLCESVMLLWKQMKQSMDVAG